MLRGVLKQTRAYCQMNNPQTLVNCLIVFKKVPIVLTLSQLLEWKRHTLNHIRLQCLDEDKSETWKQKYVLVWRVHEGKSPDWLQQSDQSLQTCWQWQKAQMQENQEITVILSSRWPWGKARFSQHALGPPGATLAWPSLPTFPRRRRSHCL